jgi:hypothetical protein
MKKVINDNVGVIIISIMISYVGLSAGGYLRVIFPGIDLLPFNKYITSLLLLILFIKYLVNNSVIHLPGLFMLIIFFSYVLLYGIFSNSTHWFFIAFSVLKPYIFFVIIINLINNEKELKILSICVSIISVVAVSIYMFGLFTNKQFGEIRLSHDIIIINGNTVSYLILLTTIFIDYNIIKRTLFFNGIKLLLYSFAAYLIIILGTRGAFILLIIAATLSVFEFKNTKELLITIAFIFGFMMLIRTIFSQTDYFNDRFVNVSNYTDEIRFQSTIYAFNRFLENPILGGNIDAIYSSVTRSMNHLWYLNVLVSYGIIGFSLLIIAFNSILKIRFRLMTRFSFTLLAFLLIHLIFAPPILYLSIVLAFLYSDTRRVKYLIRRKSE